MDITNKYKEHVELHDKKGIICFILAILFGTFGLHRIYSKKYWTGAFMCILSIVSIVLMSTTNGNIAFVVSQLIIGIILLLILMIDIFAIVAGKWIWYKKSFLEIVEITDAKTKNKNKSKIL